MILDIHIRALIKNDGLTQDTSKPELTLLVIEALKLETLMTLGWVLEVDAEILREPEPESHVRPLNVHCPYCKAPVGAACHTAEGIPLKPWSSHKLRKNLARRAQHPGSAIR